MTQSLALSLALALAYGTAKADATESAFTVPGGAASGLSGERCAPEFRYPLPASREALLALAQEADAHATASPCLQDAFFHAWRGAILVALGEPVAAVEPLERALLLRPDLPAAQFDLALALAQLGEDAVARGLLDQLEQRGDLPPALRTTLAQHRNQVSVSGQPGRASSNRWTLTTLAGVDTNLNNAPAVTELTFTLPQGTLTLPLATGSLPQRGGMRELRLQWQGLRSTAAGALWFLQADMRGRVTADSSNDLQQADAAATWLQAPHASRQWIGRLGTSGVRLGGRTLVRMVTAGVQHQWGGWQWAGFNCRPAAGAEVEDREFPASRELNGMYVGSWLSWGCQGMGKPGTETQPAQLTLQWRLGDDRPDDPSRPGGRQRRQELRFGWDAPLRSPWPGVLGAGRLGVQVTAARQRDATGYSPLIEDNSVRRGIRLSAQAEASFAIGAGLSAVVSVTATRQGSNLPAFTGRQRAVAVGLRWEPS